MSFTSSNPCTGGHCGILYGEEQTPCGLHVRHGGGRCRGLRRGRDPSLARSTFVRSKGSQHFRAVETVGGGGCGGCITVMVYSLFGGSHGC